MRGGESQCLVNSDTRTPVGRSSPQVASIRAPRRSASSSRRPWVRTPDRSQPRSTALRRSARTSDASLNRQPDKSTPRRSAPANTASVKSTSSHTIGRIRQSSNVEPNMLQFRNVLCHSVLRTNRQFRNADPRCTDSERSTPLKSHSVNTTRSVCRPARSSSRKSCPVNSRSTQCGITPDHVSRVINCFEEVTA